MRTETRRRERVEAARRRAAGAIDFVSSQFLSVRFPSSRFLYSRKGAAASEFALVLPVFLLCLFSIVTFASTLFMENNMVNAAREAVREMAVTEAPFSPGDVTCGSEEAAIVGSAEYIACTYLTFWGTDFTVNASDDCPAEEQATVRITLDASQAALMDIFGFFQDKTLSAEVSMRKEDPCV